mgnify:CR=1 FL=1
MSDKRKKTIIGAIIIAIILILVITLILLNKNKNEEPENLQNIELTTELLDTEDIESLPYETEETQEEISSKYITGRDKYEVKANVQAGETKGKMIYVRGNYDKLNIYKTEYTLNKYEDKTTKVRNIMQEFEMLCEGYMEVTDEEYKETEQLYGESSADFELPIEESIYTEGRLYSKTYKSEENEYDINFYKQDNKIICEFVKIYN